MKTIACFFTIVALFLIAQAASAKPPLTERQSAEKAGVAKPQELQLKPGGNALAASAAAPIACYNATGNLNTHDSAILCAGASSNAPLDCYNRTGQINAHDSAILCSGASSNAPIDCYNATGNLDVHNSAILCSGAESNAPIECYSKTGNISVADSAILCSRAAGRLAE